MKYELMEQAASLYDKFKANKKLIDILKSATIRINISDLDEDYDIIIRNDKYANEFMYEIITKHLREAAREIETDLCKSLDALEEQNNEKTTSNHILFSRK